MIQNAISFVAVVKAGGFSNASKVLRISKAQLSRHVSQLEKTLGVQLLYRTTRSVTLTESGEKFFLSCRDIEETYEQAVEELKQNFNAMRGTLRITAPISFGGEFLPAIIYQYTQQYPNMKVILSLSSIAEDLVENKFDLAIRVAPKLPDSALYVRTLRELDMVLCASPVYFKTNAKPTQLEDLKKLCFVTSVNKNSDTTKIYWPFNLNNKKFKFAPNNVLEIDSLRAQIKLLLLGAGIGRIPRLFIEKELQNGELIEVFPGLMQPKDYVYLLYPDKKVLPKKILAFIEFLKKSMP